MYNILFIRKKRDLHFQKPKTDIIIKRLIQYYQQQPVNFINSQPILHTNLERERESQQRKAVKKKYFSILSWKGTKGNVAENFTFVRKLMNIKLESIVKQSQKPRSWHLASKLWPGSIQKAKDVNIKNNNNSYCLSSLTTQ